MTVARAPGKAMLAGEYAVLEGAAAIVAAIARYAIADTEGAPSSRPEVVRVAEALRARAPSVDARAFEHEGRKLGLGSSAAATAAAAGAIVAQRAEDPADAATRAALLPLLIEAHRASQGATGSGADVAAALHGGVIEYESGPPARVRPFALAAGVAIVLADAGGGARTAPLVRAALEQGLPKSLLEAAPALAEALGAGGWDSIERAAALHVRGLEELGQRIGCDLVPEGFRRLAHEVRSLGGVAKPSGAGGGELSVVFARPEHADRMVQVLSRGRWAELAVIDPHGARRA